MWHGGERRMRSPSLLAFCGGLLAAASIGLSAYASHGVDDAVAQSHINTAVLYAFGHGAVLAVLGGTSIRRLSRLALYLLLLGTVLFSGSLVGGALFQWTTRFAPAGGMILMSGWLLWAVSALRR